LPDFCDRVDLRVCNKRVVESLIAAGAMDHFSGHRAQFIAALDSVFGEAQLRQAEREAGQVSLFGDGTAARHVAQAMPEVEPWSEAERLAREKEVIGFFISGHPLERYREEVALFGSRTTATLATWSDHQVAAVVVVTAVKRQISRKSGAEYARLTVEDFHGTAEALVFPEAWAKLSQIIRPDAVLLLTGGYSPRDRGEERAPFIVEGAQPVASMRETGFVGLALSWSRGQGPDRETARAAAALCTAHHGPAPVFVEWSDGNGSQARLRSRRVRVELEEDLLRGLRELLGPERVRLVRAR
jgi:DNA polymerase-3 subunit alpha